VRLAKIFFFIILLVTVISVFLVLTWREEEKAVGIQRKRVVAVATDRKEYVEGSEIKIFGESTCGNVSVSVDGEKILTKNVDGRFSASLTAVIGAHSITAEGEGCTSSRAITVLERECTGNETRDCIVNGCDGYQPCRDGRFAACRKNKRVCKPGTRIGCSLDRCRFGYKTCNECGTGYGPCEPR
jgi:hypothetical protein